VKEGIGVSLDVGVGAGALLEKREGNTTGPSPPGRIGSGALSNILFGGSSGPKSKGRFVGVGTGASLEKREGNTTGPRPPDRMGSGALSKILFGGASGPKPKGGFGASVASVDWKPMGAEKIGIARAKRMGVMRAGEYMLILKTKRLRNEVV